MTHVALPRALLRMAIGAVAAAGQALVKDVLDDDLRFCEVEDINHRGGLRAREERDRDERRDHPFGAAGHQPLAAVPVLSGEDPGPTPWPDKPGHPEPAHLGPNQSTATTT